MLVKLVECLTGDEDEDGVYIVYRHKKHIVRFAKVKEELVVQPPP